MAKNRAQFQRGLSLTEFFNAYGTEAQCAETLFKWRWPREFVCPECGRAEGCTEVKTRVLLQCRHCRHQTSLTAGTVLAYSKQPVVTGGGAASMQREDFRWLNTVLGKVKNALHGTYHKVSPQHLPRYLAEFCYRFNRRVDLAAMLPRLGVAAVSTPPMPSRLLKLAEAHW